MGKGVRWTTIKEQQDSISTKISSLKDAHKKMIAQIQKEESAKFMENVDFAKYLYLFLENKIKFTEIISLIKKSQEVI